MAPRNILTIEDEANLRELVAYNLTREGYEVLGAETGEEGLRLARLRRPDLILLDLMLPGLDGLEVCRRLKADAATREIPVLMLTAKGEETDIVAGLELGADDYVTKPFSPKVLTARVRAALRRRSKGTPSEEVVRSGGIEVNRGKREALLNGKPLALTFSEFEILAFLAGHPGWVYTRSQIVENIRGADYNVTERAVDVQIMGLRRKLGGAADLVETVRGVGYRFKETG